MTATAERPTTLLRKRGENILGEEGIPRAFSSPHACTLPTRASSRSPFTLISTGLVVDTSTGVMDMEILVLELRSKEEPSCPSFIGAASAAGWWHRQAGVWKSISILYIPRMLPFVCVVLLLTSFVADAAPPSIDTSIFLTRPPDSKALDVSAFGAIGDGVADDTKALQRALNATYREGTPDCTHPGARQLFMEGNGKRYRVSASLHLWTWVRLIGWGATRPVLLLGAATPGFSNVSAPLPLIRVIDGTPASVKPCTSNALDGGNTAFGVGVMNVDFSMGANNAGAVGIRFRAAQGGILRALRFDLDPQVLAGVHSPGWAHEDLHFVGGRAGVLVLDTGAWPSIFRDCVFEGQGVAGVAWDQQSRDGSRTTSPWEGITVVRGAFSGAPAAADASGVVCARLSILDSTFTNLSGMAVNPPSFLGNSSVLVRSCGGVGVPYLMGASDAGAAIPTPGGAGAFTVEELVGGAQTRDVDAPGGGAVNISVTVTGAAALPTPPPLPARDTFRFPPTSSWVSVADHGVVGDGVTDNAPALQALLTASPPGTPIFFPQGVYVINFTLTVTTPLTLFGLSCWDVVLTLPDAAPGFADPTHLTPILHVTSLSSGSAGDGVPWVVGMNVRSGFTFGTQPAPPPAPSGSLNPNPGALALMWEALGGGVQDVFFHPNTFPDNPRVMPSPQTELSLVVDGGGGVFADIWTCNSYSLGGVRVLNSQTPVIFYQLSTEHHAGNELLVVNSTLVVVHTMQTEDRSPDASPTASLVLEQGARVDITGLFSYYAANISSDAAVVVNAGCSCRLGAFRQWHSYHPMFYKCSVLAFDGSGQQTCVNATDVAFAGVRW